MWRLISIRYRLSLDCGLQSHPTLAITCAGNALNDFISWPGYQQVAMETSFARQGESGAEDFRSAAAGLDNRSSA
ncbi:hypothetical protein [Enterobacter sp. R1(2018)]|uniref:hypothetical protein n=1 Tax=Enterobacter sp. R1(2018) TaxID=2447891 RepID=UPI000EB31156|nr:hypothetical protein [Enterobacter sp. R1(2018)]RKQ41487.1 hypothetical protein D8M09_00570 [Enterobacter sp. R1(2018)]